MNRRNGNRLQMLLRFGMKPAILALSMVVMITSVASGSLAWLTAETHTITNTFTYGDIWIDLNESDADGDGNPNNNRYEMNPGADITKDPWVTVYKNSKDSWVFVELIESDNFSDFIEYEIADGWTELFTSANRTVYYREVGEASADQSFIVLKDNKVKVKDTVTKEQFEALTYYPTLQIKAYAVQKDDGIDAINSAEKAWQIIKEADKDLLAVDADLNLLNGELPDQPEMDKILQQDSNVIDDTDSFIIEGAQQADKPAAEIEQQKQQIEQAPDTLTPDEPQQPAGEQTQTEGESQQPGTDESEQPNGNPPAGALVDPANPDGPSA